MSDKHAGYTIQEYETEDGQNPFANWALKLPRQHFERVQEALLRIAAGKFGDVKHLGGGVKEKKLKNPPIRIYFAQDGHELIILLTGGQKKKQSQDIEKAKTYWRDYKARKKASKR